MSLPADSFRINLNQNLWGLAIALTSLGFAEHYKLVMLDNISTALACVMGLSVTVTTVAYTWKYCRKKWE